MKTFRIILLFVTASLFNMGCSEDRIGGKTIYPTDEVARTKFDQWILENYTRPYNIVLNYRTLDHERTSVEVLPAKLENSIMMAVMMKHMWLDAYEEVGGADFVKMNAPKVIAFYGYGTAAAGTAEGGQKLNLFNINNVRLDVDYLNETYMKTIHHEFAHLMDAMKNQPIEYKYISEADYVGNSYKDYKESEALQMGFISPYSMTNATEDFAEMLSHYVMRTQNVWDNKLLSAGETGRKIIELKLELVRNYMLESWDIDLDILRAVCRRRTSEFDKIDFNI